MKKKSQKYNQKSVKPVVVQTDDLISKIKDRTK